MKTKTVHHFLSSVIRTIPTRLSFEVKSETLFTIKDQVGMRISNRETPRFDFWTLLMVPGRRNRPRLEIKDREVVTL